MLTDDPVKLQRQYDILKLFVRVHQETLYKEHAEIAKTYQLDGANYKVSRRNLKSPRDLSQPSLTFEFFPPSQYPELVKQFMCRYEAGGLLPRGEPFSVYLENQLEEVKLVVDLLYFAKDIDTFFKVRRLS